MTEDVMPLRRLLTNIAFNWHVLEVNGNDISAFIAAIEEANYYEADDYHRAHNPGKVYLKLRGLPLARKPPTKGRRTIFETNSP